MDVLRNFSREGQCRHFSYPFQAADDALQMGVHKTLSLSTKKTPYVTATITKTALRWRSKLYFFYTRDFFSHSIKFRGLPLSAVTVSLHYLSKMFAFNSHKRQNAYQYHRNLKWTFQDSLPSYCYAIKTSSRTVRLQVSQPASALSSWVANLAFLKSDFEIFDFLTRSAVFDKARQNQSILGRKGLTLTKRFLSCIFITNFFWWESMPCTHAGCKEYCKYFTVALNMLDLFNKKQMYVTVITGKENTSEDWNCITSMFQTSFNIYFVFGYACFMYVYVLWLLSGFFGD